MEKNLLAEVESVIQYHKGLCYENTEMALELICGALYYERGIDAKYRGRSIYIGKARVASIETCREGKGIVGIYRYKIIAGKEM